MKNILAGSALAVVVLLACGVTFAEGDNTPDSDDIAGQHSEATATTTSK